jgi:hypothetical protein
MEREGEALWSPDSKRVACLSSDLTQQEGDLFGSPRPAPLRKQTAVYQLAGENFVAIDLSLGNPPGRDGDAELEGAVVVHEFTEPVRWQKPTVLILQRHEHFRKMVPIKIGEITGNSIRDLGRLYQITATVQASGKAAVTWKLRDD